MACLETIAWVCIVLGKTWSLGLWRPRQEDWELPFVMSAAGPGAPSSARLPLCQLPQGGGYSGSEVSCFAQAQIAANRNGGVCHTVHCSGLGGRGLPQASLPPVAPLAVTLGSEGGGGP